MWGRYDVAIRKGYLCPRTVAETLLRTPVCRLASLWLVVGAPLCSGNVSGSCSRVVSNGVELPQDWSICFAKP